MPFRYDPSHWRQRAAQMARLPSIRKTVKPQHLCSRWRKTTTSLRIAPRYVRKTGRNQKRLPDSGSADGRVSGPIAQQQLGQLGDVDGDGSRVSIFVPRDRCSA
jgi:hypothetical protein